MAGWYLWWKQRQIVHDKAVPIRYGNCDTNIKLQMANQNTKSIPKIGWRKAQEGMCVMNVDVAFDMDSGFGATGVIIHDGHGTSLVEANNFF